MREHDRNVFAQTGLIIFDLQEVVAAAYHNGTRHAASRGRAVITFNNPAPSPASHETIFTLDP